MRKAVYNYVDREVPVLVRIAAEHAAGNSAIGYTIANIRDCSTGKLGWLRYQSLTAVNLALAYVSRLLGHRIFYLTTDAMPS